MRKAYSVCDNTCKIGKIVTIVNTWNGPYRLLSWVLSWRGLWGLMIWKSHPHTLRLLVGGICGWTSSWVDEKDCPWLSPAFLTCDITHVASTLYLSLPGGKKQPRGHRCYLTGLEHVELQVVPVPHQVSALQSKHNLHKVLTMEITATPTSWDTRGLHVFLYI